jgi:hypothetical protein
MGVQVRLAGGDTWREYEQALEGVKSTGEYDGIALVIDELGKFLEYAALHPEEDDIFVLQELAEGAARNPGSFVVLTILHSSFSDYLASSSEVQLAEWQKVQGRFADVAFHVGVDHMLLLTGAALNASWPNELNRAYQDYVGGILSSRALDVARKRVCLDSIPHCLPLHPMTALLLWPLFRSKLAQNERSLFGFLTGSEPFGLQEFLRSATWAGGRPPVYRVADLYDYVTNSLGSGTVLGDRARYWAEIQHAIDRLPATAPPSAADVLKTVGLIGLYGWAVGLRPSREVLELALDEPDSVRRALDYLERASLVVYRRHESAYGLWQGSDVDLDACLDEALRLTEGASLAERLKRVLRTRPWVARAHSVRTGTLRYFDVTVVNELSALGKQSPWPPERHADGQVVFVLSQDRNLRASVIHEARMLSERLDAEGQLVLLALPKPVAGLEAAVRTLEAWMWVLDNVPALLGDAVARKEVRARISDARERLGQVAGEVLGLVGHQLDPQASDWIFGGQVQPPRSNRQFSRWLSELCDQVYSRAPILHNELLNREELSSAAAAARRNLLEAMIQRENEERLGIRGAPAELSMYRSLLQEGRFHRLSSSGWRFGSPATGWRPVWEAMEAFISETPDGPKPIPELLTRLRRPPLGLRSGPLPVILLALLLAKSDEVALYEDGVFVPALRIETVERLVRKADHFSLRLLRLTKAAQDVLEALMPLFSDSRAKHGNGTAASLLSVSRRLLQYVADLPAYSQQTRRFDYPQTPLVREALLRATDPYALLFEQLPGALGVSTNTENGTRLFAKLLHQVVVSLEQVYPALLDEVENGFRVAFGLVGTGAAAATELRERAARVDGYATDRRLAQFIREALRVDGDRWRQRLAGVVVDGMPPSHWRDPDVVTFQARARVLASDFLRLEELASEFKRLGGIPVVRVEVLNTHMQQARHTLQVPQEDEAVVQRLVDRLGMALDELCADADSQRLRLAALARVVAREAGKGMRGEG